MGAQGIDVAARSLRDRFAAAVDGRYTIERELGRGGMGAVFLAHDQALDRQVAVKVLPPEFATQPELRERFLRETRTAAGFSHPNIVPVHAVEERDGLLFFVMGFVDGETLTQRVARGGPLGTREVTRLLQEVAWALSYAHARGVVHRDVKPDNILIERATGRALVTDFGIARTAGPSGLTSMGEILGTPHFMSPEQAAGERVDGRSDLYALGAVAFFAVTGRPLFDADSTAAILAMQITREPPRVSALRADLPAPLAAVIDRCLAKEPDARFPNGEAVVDALEAVRAVQPEVAPSIRLFQVKADQGLRSVFLVGVLSPLLMHNLRDAGDRLGIILLFAGVISGVLWQVLSSMRALAHQGFAFADVRAGILSIAAEREETAKQYRATSAQRAARRGVRAQVAAALLSAVCLMIARLLRERHPEDTRLPLVGLTLFAVGIMLAVFVVVSIVARPGQVNVFDRLSQRVWTGPVGAACFALARWRLVPPRVLLPTLRVGPSTAQRASARTLLDALPREQRRRLSDTGAVIDGLQERLRALDDRARVLEDATAEATRAPGLPGSELAIEREALAAELRDARLAVDDERRAAAASLERVRLQLLRLRSGLGSAEAVQQELAAARVLLGGASRS